MEDYCVAHAMSRRVALIRLGLLVICSSLSVAHADNIDPKAAKTHFHIESAAGAAALNEFSRQAQLQLLFDSKILNGVRTRAIDGSYTPVEALEKMLEGTGMIFSWINGRTLFVQPKAGER